MVAEESFQQREQAVERLAHKLATAICPFFVGHNSNPEVLGSTLVPFLASWLRSPANAEAARELGRQFVEAGCFDTVAVEHALPLLGDYLQRALPGARAAELYRLLGAFAGSLTGALRERTLRHQEELHQALRDSRDAAQAALEEESRFVNAILDHIEALVVVATADGTITRFNKTAQRVTGYALKEIASATDPVGRPLVSSEAVPAVLDAIARLQAEPEALRSLPVRTGVRTRSGDIRQVDWVITLLFDEDGQFSHYVASGIDVTAQLQMEIELQEARRLMDERENAMQRSLARSLHDGPVQELLSLSHAVADMQTRAQADQLWTPRQRLEELIPALEIVRRKLVSVATGLRVLIAELRPPGLEEMGLRQALEVLLHQHSEGLEPPWPEVTLTIDSSVDLLQEPTHTALYYLIREALRNVQRHAQASKAEVVVRVEADRVHLLVRDDGCGFVVPDRLTRLVHDQKYGLVGMEERVRLRGGEMTIESRPGQGTTVRVSFPIEQLRR